MKLNEFKRATGDKSENVTDAEVMESCMAVPKQEKQVVAEKQTQKKKENG